MKKNQILCMLILLFLGLAKVRVRAEAADYSGTWYLLSAVKEGMVLDVSGGRTADRANVQIWKRNGTGAQQFRIEKAGRYYRIINVRSGRALDVAGAGKNDRANVQIYRWNGTKAQLWEIRQAGGGYVSFVNAGSGKALDTAGGKRKNGTNVWQYTVNRTAAQRWKLIRVSGAETQRSAAEKQAAQTPGIRSGGVYTILSAADPGYALDVKGSGTGNGVNVQVYRENGTKAQQWKIQWAGGFYRIICAGSGRVLDVTSAKTADGTNVQQWSMNGTGAQSWKIAKNADGTYSFRTALREDAALDLSGARAVNGGNVRIYTENGTKAQKWILAEYGRPDHTHEWIERKVLVKEAYDETRDEYEYHTYCYTCGAYFDDWSEEEIIRHGKLHKEAGEEWGHWGFGKVKTGTATVHHGAEYRTETVCAVCGKKR